MSEKMEVTAIQCLAVLCPKCGVDSTFPCRGKRRRVMQTFHTARIERAWYTKRKMLSKIKKQLRTPLTVSIRLTSDVCRHCHQPRSEHLSANYSYNDGASYTAMFWVCPTSIFST